MKRRIFTTTISIGSLFGAFGLRTAHSDGRQLLSQRVEDITTLIRSRPITAIRDDTLQTAPILSNIIQDTIADLTIGMTTAEIDQLLINRILSHGLLPSMLGYKGYPAGSALSIAPALLHSPPSDQRISEGDLLTIQVSASSEFSHASQGITVPIGCPSPIQKKLLSGCKDALQRAVAIIRSGIKTGEISAEMQATLAKAELAPIRDFCGYTMGKERIERPNILTYGSRAQGDIITEGMILNLHVFATSGDIQTRIGSDKWTASMKDGAPAALATAMVLVKENSGQELTRPIQHYGTACAS